MVGSGVFLGGVGGVLSIRGGLFLRGDLGWFCFWGFVQLFLMFFFFFSLRSMSRAILLLALGIKTFFALRGIFSMESE
jgi:hypothetical protein